MSGYKRTDLLFLICWCTIIFAIVVVLLLLLHFKQNFDSIIVVWLVQYDPEKYFIDKLTVDHADYITNYWTDKNKPIPIIQKYLQSTFTMYNFSTGIFLRSHPSNPVSWMTYSDYGHATFLYTIPEYRGNGFYGITMATLFSNLLDNDIVPLGERTKGSYLSKKFSHIEKCIPGYTWRDSITGKCYWQIIYSYTH